MCIRDRSKPKKVNPKEASKLKVLKPVVNTPIESVPDTPTPTRPEKLKIPQVVPHTKEPKPPKQTKAEKKLEKIQQEQVVVSEKLTTEPNKQKLNIFRRISKVKEERAESPAPKNVEDKNASINESIENLSLIHISEPTRPY